MLEGKTCRVQSEFVLDTGASITIIDHELALDLGYSARDGSGISRVSSVLGQEEGYRLKIQSIEALGKKLKKAEVRCHDLRDQGIEGLLGMSFLENFDWCVHPSEKIISLK